VLYLVADDGGTLLPALPLNGSGSVSNGQCTVTGAGSSGSGSGNYTASRDGTDANNSGWQSVGSWTVQ